MISVRPAGHMSVRGKNLNVAIFSDILKIINVKLCMVVVLIEHYPFIPLSVTLIVFQGHSSVKQFLLKNVFSCPIIRWKLCMIVDSFE